MSDGDTCAPSPDVDTSGSDTSDADTSSPSSDVDTSDAGDHFVYVVECADGTYYTGYTTDVERRVAEHNAGTGARYTRGRTPVRVVHTETYPTQSDAMKREYAIKQLRRAQKDALIR